jgi:acylphosphatase
MRTMAARIRRRVVVSGRVQGVAFRASAWRQARVAGVDGFVRNLADGRVEAVFEGAPDAVAGLLAWCRTGPSGARVDRVETSEEPPEDLAGFEIR